MQAIPASDVVLYNPGSGFLAFLFLFPDTYHTSDAVFRNNNACRHCKRREQSHSQYRTPAWPRHIPCCSWKGAELLYSLFSNQSLHPCFGAKMVQFAPYRIYMDIVPHDCTIPDCNDILLNECIGIC